MPVLVPVLGEVDARMRKRERNVKLDTNNIVGGKKRKKNTMDYMRSMQEIKVRTWRVGVVDEHASTLRVVDESDAKIGEANVDGNKDGEVAVYESECVQMHTKGQEERNHRQYMASKYALNTGTTHQTKTGTLTHTHTHTHTQREREREREIVPKELPFRVGSEVEELQYRLVADVYWIPLAVLSCTQLDRRMKTKRTIVVCQNTHEIFMMYHTRLVERSL